MRFSWDFLQNMLENGDSNLQTNLWVHITSNIFKISNSKITGSHQPPPDLPTLKAYPTPGVGGRFGIFSLKWRERKVAYFEFLTKFHFEKCKTFTRVWCLFKTLKHFQHLLAYAWAMHSVNYSLTRYLIRRTLHLWLKGSQLDALNS